MFAATLLTCFPWVMDSCFEQQIGYTEENIVMKEKKIIVLVERVGQLYIWTFYKVYYNTNALEYVSTLCYC